MKKAGGVAVEVRWLRTHFPENQVPFLQTVEFFFSPSHDPLNQLNHGTIIRKGITCKKILL